MIEVIADGVASLTVSTEEDPYLRPGWVDAVVQAAESVTTDDSIRTVVLKGGPEYFSAGAAREDLIADDARATIRRYVSEVPRALLSIPVPVVAAMAGHAIGGGLLIGLWADVPVLARECLYGVNFMALGFTPGMGSTRAVEAHFGEPLGRRMLYGGELLKGREIEEAHVPISHAVHDQGEVFDRALEIAEQFAEAPRRSLELLKATLAGRRREVLEAAIEDETAMHAELFSNPETRAHIATRYGSTDT